MGRCYVGELSAPMLCLVRFAPGVIGLHASQPKGIMRTSVQAVVRDISNRGHAETCLGRDNDSTIVGEPPENEPQANGWGGSGTQDGRPRKMGKAAVL